MLVFCPFFPPVQMMENVLSALGQLFDVMSLWSLRSHFQHLKENILKRYNTGFTHFSIAEVDNLRLCQK